MRYSSLPIAQTPYNATLEQNAGSIVPSLPFGLFLLSLLVARLVRGDCQQRLGPRSIGIRGRMPIGRPFLPVHRTCMVRPGQLQGRAIITVSTGHSLTTQGTCRYWSPCSDCRILCVSECLSGIPHNAMDCESRQSHTCHTLKYGSLSHNSPIVVNCRDARNALRATSCASFRVRRYYTSGSVSI